MEKVNSIEDAKVVSEKVITLTDKQKQIVANILQTKGALEAEYKKTQEREAEVLVTLFESNSISGDDVTAVNFKDGNIVITLKGE
jgi:hypothetical protein